MRKFYLLLAVMVLSSGFALPDDPVPATEKPTPSTENEIEVASLETGILDLTEVVFSELTTGAACNSALLDTDCSADQCEINGEPGACCMIGGIYFGCEPCGSFMPIKE